MEEKKVVWHLIYIDLSFPRVDDSYSKWAEQRPPVFRTCSYISSHCLGDNMTIKKQFYVYLKVNMIMELNFSLKKEKDFTAPKWTIFK